MQLTKLATNLVKSLRQKILPHLGLRMAQGRDKPRVGVSRLGLCPAAAARDAHLTQVQMGVNLPSGPVAGLAQSN